MIPPFLVKRFGELGAKIALAIVAAALVAGGYLAVRHFFLGGVKTEIKLQGEQGKAATASGHDAVETVGNRQAADAAGDQTVAETKDAIDNASDAGGVTDAGRNGLCGLAGNRGKPECMRKPSPH